jgi:predicted nucleic acid-binding protein
MRSVKQRSTHVYGIDTSVFVRLLTGHPAADFAATVDALKRMHDRQPATEIVVSNQVVGEAYIALQHHYGVSKLDARAAILELFATGSFQPMNGAPVIQALEQRTGAGLIDRLIAQDYSQVGVRVLTNDKRMAQLPGVALLR